MRSVTLFFILSFSLLFGSAIDKKIKIKQKEISSKKVEYNKMDKRLSAVAQKILTAKAGRNKLNKKLSKLEQNIEANQDKFNKLNQKKRELDRELSTLGSTIEEKREKFIILVADKFSMALVLEELDKPTPESVMLQEAYGVYAKKNDQEIEKLKEEIGRLKTKEDYFVNKQKNIKRSISNHKKERQEYQEKKSKKTKLIKELARDKAIYKKRFDRIRASKRSLQRKLTKLKIVKQEEEISQEEQRVAKKEAKKEERSTQSGRKNRPVKTTTYTGRKTISPLSGSRLIKKFGTYIDPIYKFKIFNKSITLKAPHKGAKVKSVLGGEIVFAENSGGMLGKVVIVSHPNKLHTIYAKLSRLAPGIHVGKKVSKGSVIGKVSKSLMFEVTKNNKHMNPLKLIRL